MKKATAILFAVFYLMVSLGVNLNLHYCGGKLAGVSIAFKASACCCDPDGKKSCCADTEIALDIDLDQQVSYPPSYEEKLALTQVALNFVESNIPQIEHPTFFPNYPNPPPRSSQKRRILLGSLTYYG